jgi:hypothetical protein
MNHNDTRTSKAGSGILTARQAPGGAVHRTAREFGGSPLSLVSARSSGQVTGSVWRGREGGGIGNLTAPAAGSGAVNMWIPCHRPAGEHGA